MTSPHHFGFTEPRTAERDTVTALWLVVCLMIALACAAACVWGLI